eukprot:CAMPEP_0176061056 /NCGR_PEP_ID=MMETSP0120_2-20121206/30437_1 /TAXON_ID=160619 /ORGANISM="Kryptoperidinium foliaceum, Strain CCMP 1326" /LENGTH=411 /DNA_ID=CAMNT_0017394607 /DNA_START=79 /DNA_END=1314 /DNA_ORIENTATION=+
MLKSFETTPAGEADKLLQADRPDESVLTVRSSPNMMQSLTEMPGLADGEVSLPITDKEFEMSRMAVDKDLPESIYGAAMMAFIRSSQTFRGTVHSLTFFVFSALVVNVLVQIYVLVCAKLYITMPAVAAVRELYASFHQHAFPDGEFSQEGWDQFGDTDALCQMPLSQPMFFFCILGIWTATCYVDLLESLQVVDLWVRLPTDVDAGKTTKVELKKEEDTIILKGASMRAKALAIALIPMPKIIIACMLWWLGARWLVATTSFQDLLLNAVALAFVTEMDELMYAACMPGDVQTMVQMFKIESPPPDDIHVFKQVFKIADPQAERESTEDATTDKEGDAASKKELEKMKLKFIAYRDCNLVKLMLRMLFTAAVVVGLPALYMYKLQQVLPDYKWDVHALCQARAGNTFAIF